MAKSEKIDAFTKQLEEKNKKLVENAAQSSEKIAKLTKELMEEKKKLAKEAVTH